MKPKLTRRRGIALIWVVMLLLTLIGFVGLATDVAWGVLVVQQLQNTADASALAAAQLVKSDQGLARIAAFDIAALNTAAGDHVQLELNSANLDTGDIVIGHYDRDKLTFTATTDSPNAVKVVARRTDTSLNGRAPLFFGGIFGVPDINLERSGIAMVGGGTGAGLIALDANANCSLSVGGTGDLVVNDGAIQVNSDANCAACSNGNPTIQGPELNVAGGECFGGNTNWSGEVSEGAPPIPDPLAFLPEPEPGPTQPAVSKNADQTIQPGYYPNGIERTGGVLTCEPGVYYIDAVSGNNCSQYTGFSVTGGDVIAHECMFFLKKGGIDFRGNGIFEITPPESGTYEHVTIFQARGSVPGDCSDGNTCQSEINGTASMSILGTLYFPCANLVLSGTEDGINFQQLIVNTIEIQGTGLVVINYDGSFPAPGNQVFLVE